MTKTYHANGKLLLTGEYFILDGAVSLALPTKFGQALTASTDSEGSSINLERLAWKSIDSENKIWFEANFSESLEVISSSDNEVAKTLQNILRNCQLSTINHRLSTNLDFPHNWGLGSSSTLISLLAQWANVDPYELLAKTFGGSGYDIACATANGAITYQLVNRSLSIDHRLSSIDYRPSFKDQLYFVHLGKKQNSREGIQHYKNLEIDKSTYIEQISELTQKIIQANQLNEFCYYLEVHENIVADVLKLKKVKELYFSDFPGTVKSLGAWGGDFVLAASDEAPQQIIRYFQQKGFPTVLPYDKIIL